MLSKLAVRRLTKLADYMEKLPKAAEKHFSMQAWFRHDGEHPFLKDGESPQKKHYFDCGTSACALGWAATMPYFRKAGLKIFYGDAGGDISFRGCSVFCDDTATSGLFELDEHQSRMLFGPSGNIRTPKQWAKLCRRFVRDNA